MTRPTFFEKFKADQYIMGFSLNVLIFTVVAVLGFTTLEEMGSSVYLFLGLDIILVAIITILSMRINRIFDNGTIVKGRVISVSRWRKNGNLVVEYQYNYETYTKRLTINQFIVSRLFKEEMEIEVIVENEKPKNVLVIDAFKGRHDL